MKVSDTMKVLRTKEDKLADYVVIKIGNSVFSTSYDEINIGSEIAECKVQITETIGVGIQENTWVKGVLSETKGHHKLKEKIPFEINIYTKYKEVKK